MSTHPLKYKNSTGASMPKCGIFALGSATRQASGELNPHAGLAAANGSEALYVNSELAVASDGYGNCRSCTTGAFWVRYNTANAPVDGSIVGPVAGETYVDDTGEGFVAIYVDTDKELVLCEKVGGTGSTDDSDGFPDGTNGCDCDHCLEGITIPDGVECCKSHTTWSLVNPWLTCTETELLLHYAGGDTWISDVFDGPTGNANTYRFQLTIDVDGVLSGVPNYTYLALVLEDDNGGDDVCLQYGRLGFDCQCDNLLTRKKPFGKVSGVAIADTSCNVCLKPEVPEYQVPISCCSGTIDMPQWWFSLDLSNATLCTPAATCEAFSGTYISPHSGCRQVIDVGSEGLPCGATGAFGNAARQIIIETTSHSFNPGCRVWLTLYYAAPYSLHNGQWCSDVLDPDTFDPNAPLDLTRFLPSDCDGTFCCENEPVVLTPVGVITAADGSGACGDDDCTPGTAPSNPSGACCYGGYCLDFIDETLCDDFGGVWFADSADCDTNCNPTGACCVPGAGVGSGGCFNGTTAVCSAVGGTFVTGADCDDDPCVGACCRSDGSCEDGISEADCDGAGEYFWGPGTTCGTVDGCHSCCVSTLGGGSEDCVTDGDCECVYVASEAACFVYSGSDDTKAYHAAPCAARVCDCDSGSETCDNNPA